MARDGGVRDIYTQTDTDTDKQMPLQTPPPPHTHMIYPQAGAVREQLTHNFY